MKILHISCVKSARRNSGVVRQLSFEQNANLLHRLNWTTELHSSDFTKNSLQKPLGWASNWFFVRRIKFYIHLSKELKKYDYILIRYMPLDFLMLLLSQDEKKKIIIVYHTLRSKLFQNVSFGGQFIFLIDDWLQKKIKIGLLGICGVTKQITKSETPSDAPEDILSLTYPNGIISHVPPDNFEDRRGGKIKFAFIASNFFPWNGLEELLDSLDSCFEDCMEIYLVGKLMNDAQRKKVAELSSFIIHYDYLTSDEIGVLYKKIDVSLGAFCLSKVGLTEACTLKVRESFANGVPVYSGHVDSMFEKCQFYKCGDLNWSEMFDFAFQMRSYEKSEIYESTYPLMDKSIQMQIIKDAIQEKLL